MFHLLKDNNSDVQSQAVKTFAPLLVYISSSLTIEVINKLFELVEVENKKDMKKITISIPNMALRSIFAFNKFSFQTSRNVIDSLIPRLLAYSSSMTIDLIEILTYLVKYIGSAFARNELQNISQALIGIIYNEHGIVGKRSISVLDLLLGYLKDGDSDIINDLVKVTTPLRSGSESLSLSLYSVLLKNSIPKDSTTELLDSNSIELIFEQITQSLQLGELNVELDPSDFDYDLLVQQCSIREDGLSTLSTFVNILPYTFFEPFASHVVKYIKLFLKYDPLNFGQESEDKFEDEDDLDSDIEFSDDEFNEGFDDENDNDCSWKLRKQSANLIKDLCHKFPVEYLETLFTTFVNKDYLMKTLNDRNNMVSDEAIGSLVYIFQSVAKIKKANSVSRRRRSDVSMLGELDTSIYDILPVLENEIFENLLIEKKTSRFTSVFLGLIESVCGLLNHCPSEEFLIKLHQVFINLNIKTSGVSEYLHLYKVILHNCDDIPPVLVSHIINDLTTSIQSEKSYLNIIMESLITSSILFKKFRCNLRSDEVVQLQIAIIEKTHNKQYSSDLRQSSIKSLSALVYNIELDPPVLQLLLAVIQESLNYEATVKIAIESIIKLFNKDCVNNIEDNEFKEKVISKLIEFINSPDDSLYYTSLNVLEIVTTTFYTTESSRLILNEVISSLLSFLKNADMKQTLITFNILTNLFQSTEEVVIDASFIELIINIINTKFDKEQVEFDLDDFEDFIKELCNQIDPLKLFQELYAKLNLNLYISAIALSFIALKGQLAEIIDRFESELLNGDNILFNIQFLGIISASLELKQIDLSVFIKHFDTGSSDSIKVASAKAIGLFAFRDVEKYIPIFVTEYANVDNHREMILIAFKEILINYNPSLDEETEDDEVLFDDILRRYSQIWNCIWDQSNIREHGGINTAEAKFIGDISSRICGFDGSYINKLNERASNDENLMIKYTLIVVLKQLLSDSREIGASNRDSTSDPLLTDYFVRCLKFFKILNISIKQTLIGTLLTGLHNKPQMFYPLLQNEILPIVYNELEAKPEFKKTIPMGPYKYNIDEGLEIRKLSYEFLYTILSIDKDMSTEYGVKYFDLINEILQKGFKDTENDIIILSSINLSTFISKSPEILNELEILEKLMEQIKLVLNKKLRAKASRQETESYEETQKSVLRLSKQINTVLSNFSDNKNTKNINIDGKQLLLWNSYYSEVKGSFEL